MLRDRTAAVLVLGLVLLLSGGCDGRAREPDSTIGAQVALPPCPKGVPPWRVTGKCILQDK